MLANSRLRPHPCARPGWCVLQGTYLPASVAEDLAAMQQHAELLAAMERLRGLVAAAGELRGRLASRPSMSLPRWGC